MTYSWPINDLLMTYWSLIYRLELIELGKFSTEKLASNFRDRVKQLVHQASHKAKKLALERGPAPKVHQCLRQDDACPREAARRVKEVGFSHGHEAYSRFNRRATSTTTLTIQVMTVMRSINRQRSRSKKPHQDVRTPYGELKQKSLVTPKKVRNPPPPVTTKRPNNQRPSASGPQPDDSSQKQRRNPPLVTTNRPNNQRPSASVPQPDDPSQQQLKRSRNGKSIITSTTRSPVKVGTSNFQCELERAEAQD